MSKTLRLLDFMAFHLADFVDFHLADFADFHLVSLHHLIKACFSGLRFTLWLCLWFRYHNEVQYVVSDS